MELLVGVSSATMKSLMGKLGGLLAQEYTLIKGVRDDIQNINDELASMYAFLRSLNHGDARSEQTKDWMKQVRDVAYDIEDCVDDISRRLSREPRGDGCTQNVLRAWYVFTTLLARHDIAGRIGRLKSRAQHVGERRTRYGVNNPNQNQHGGDAQAGSSTPTYHTMERPAPAPQVTAAEQPVGMDAAILDLGNWISDNSEHNELRVLAIAGFGGLGKTTLASALLRTSGGRFDSRACVHASQKLNLESLLRSLLKQVMPHGSSSLKGIDGWNQKQLKDMVESHLAEKRYFILVDDVWSVSAWESIWACLPKNKAGGSIVVTTRFKFVADACYRQRAGYVHMLERLPKDKSRSLLSEKIFGSAGDPCPEDCVDDVKEMIIKKCGGVPLAIVAVAGLLASKLTVEQDFKLDSNLKSKPRLKLAKNIWTDVCNSLSSELEVNLNPEGVTHILNLCYNDLQADQKTCLLYLTIFPKGCFIGRKRLIRRWIAEGFITEKHGKTMQEVADDYFNELYSRNVIRPVDLSSNGKVKTCQVHDMILEYLLSKSSEENFVTAVGGHWLTPTPSNKVRRLSLHGSDPSHAKEAIGSMNLSHVRSLSVFDNLNQLSFFKFGILQVLDLQGCKGLNMDRLKKICKMFQLKFLSLRKTDIRALPSRITKLRYLETLDIRETEVRQLATSIGRLQRMTHLLAGDKSKRLALKFNDGIAKMIALQTLSGIEICGSSRTALADMHNLTKLKKLSIYNLRDMGSGSNQSYEVLLSAILYLSGCSLNSLAIDDGFVGFFEHLDSLPAPPRYLHALNLSGKLCRLPQWISDLQNLEKLTLSLTSLRTDALKLLSALRTLFSLTFTLHAANHQDADVLDILQNNVLQSDGEIFVSPGGFDCLKLLRFSAPALPLLSFLQGAMPNLEKLELMFRSLTGAYGLENLKSLQQVVLKISNRASIAAKAKVGDIRKSISKLDNVPTVIVDEYFESM